MSTNDYTTLARQFMDMWQKQMHQAMTEPGFVNAMMDTMGQPKEQAENDQGEAQNRQSSAASESRDEQLDELTRRIRILEKRVAELERAEPNQSAKPTKAKPAKPTPKKAIRKRAIKPVEKQRPKRATANPKKPIAKRSTKAKRK